MAVESKEPLLKQIDSLQSELKGIGLYTLKKSKFIGHRKEHKTQFHIRKN